MFVAINSPVLQYRSYAIAAACAVLLCSCGPSGYEADPTLNFQLRDQETPQVQPLRDVLPDPETILTAPPELEAALPERNTDLADQVEALEEDIAIIPPATTLNRRARDLRARADALRAREEL